MEGPEEAVFPQPARDLKVGGPAGLSPSSPELSPAVKAREAEPNVSRAANGCTPPDGRHKASLTGRGAGAASDGGAAGVRRSEPAGTGRNRPVPPPPRRA